jgi:hypothetical protein
MTDWIHDISVFLPDVKASFVFYEERNQKTFIFRRSGNIPAMAADVGAAEELKVFWFFSSEKNIFLYPELL